MSIPFAVRRPWLLMRGALTPRERPPLERLASITDPMQFVWAILPHAARAFAPSILMLPAPHSRTAAVAYLYCRMLDTYEDLSSPTDRQAGLEAFAARMRTLEPVPAVPLEARNARDRAHLLLVERCRLVDEVFVTIPAQDRERVVSLVESMAKGMVWSAQRLAAQGGVLADAGQLSRYCHHVIGEPVLFALGLVADVELTPQRRRDALAVSELIQLANITRDLERDLERGIAYHPSLLPHLGRRDADGPVREARRQLMAQALPHATAFARLSEGMGTSRFSLARASAVVMLLHTDRHYERCARTVGLPGWRGPGKKGTMVLAGFLAAFSRRWSQRLMRRVEHDFLSAAAALQAG